MRTIVFVVGDATVFAHFQFVAIIIGSNAVTFVLGEIVCIDPEVVIDAFVVDEHAWRIVSVEGEGDEKMRCELSSEPDVEVLLFVARSHHITEFGVG